MTLQDELWTHPEAVFKDSKVSALYSQIADDVRQELTTRGSDTLDHMLTERVVFMYCHIRDKDAKAGTSDAWAHDRVRRETLHDWAGLIENLKRRWLREDIADAEDTIKRKFGDALNEALLDMDPTMAAHFRDSLAAGMEKAGL